MDGDQEYEGCDQGWRYLNARLDRQKVGLQNQFYSRGVSQGGKRRMDCLSLIGGASSYGMFNFCATISIAHCHESHTAQANLARDYIEQFTIELHGEHPKLCMTVAFMHSRAPTIFRSPFGTITHHARFTSDCSTFQLFVHYILQKWQARGTV